MNRIKNDAEAAVAYAQARDMIRDLFRKHIQNAKDLGSIASDMPSKMECPFEDEDMMPLKEAWYQGYMK